MPIYRSQERVQTHSIGILGKFAGILKIGIRQSWCFNIWNTVYQPYRQPFLDVILIPYNLWRLDRIIYLIWIIVFQLLIQFVWNLLLAHITTDSIIKSDGVRFECIWLYITLRPSHWSPKKDKRKKANLNIFHWPWILWGIKNKGITKLLKII